MCDFFAQKRIAGLVAECIAKPLEVIDIQREQRD